MCCADLSLSIFDRLWVDRRSTTIIIALEFVQMLTCWPTHVQNFKSLNLAVPDIVQAYHLTFKISHVCSLVLSCLCDEMTE